MMVDAARMPFSISRPKDRLFSTQTTMISGALRRKSAWYTCFSGGPELVLDPGERCLDFVLFHNYKVPRLAIHG